MTDTVASAAQSAIQAEDILNVVVRQRDEAMNKAAHLEALLMAAQREIGRLNLEMKKPRAEVLSQREPEAA